MEGKLTYHILNSFLYFFEVETLLHQTETIHDEMDATHVLHNTVMTIRLY
jgi:hypothetical protein